MTGELFEELNDEQLAEVVGGIDVGGIDVGGIDIANIVGAQVLQGNAVQASVPVSIAPRTPVVAPVDVS